MTYAEAIKKLRNKMILSQMEFSKKPWFAQVT